MASLNRAFKFQMENSKKELVLQFGVIVFLGAVLLPILNFIVLPKEIIPTEKWIYSILIIYESLIHIIIFGLVQTSYFKEFPAMIKLGITRDSFWKSNTLILLIRIVFVSLFYGLLGKIIAFYFNILDKPYSLMGSFIYGFNYDLIQNSLILLSLKVFYIILLASFSVNILGIIFYKKKFSYRFFFLAGILGNALIRLALEIQWGLLSTFLNSSLLIQGLICILIFLLGNSISQYFIKSANILD